jgi:chromosome segregation ATPase
VNEKLDQALEEVQRCCDQVKNAQKRIEDLESVEEYLEDRIRMLEEVVEELGEKNKKLEKEAKEDEEMINALRDIANQQGPNGNGDDEEDPEEKEITEVEPEEKPEHMPAPPRSTERDIYMQVLTNFVEGQNDEDDFDEEEWFPDKVEHF